MLIDGARSLATADAASPDAVELLREALQLHDVLDTIDVRVHSALLGCLLAQRDVAAAIEHQQQLLQLWIKKPNLPEAHRVVNTLVVLHLAQEDRVAAKRQWQNAMGDVQDYVSSDQCLYVEELLNAMDTADATALERLKKSSKFTYLEAPVVRLFRGLEVQATGEPGKEDMT